MPAFSSVLVAAGACAFATAAAAADWTRQDIQDLRIVAASAAEEGLDPADYALNDVPAEFASAEADRVALLLAHDLFEGRARSRSDWHIRRDPVDYRPWLEIVVDRHLVRTAFPRLLPTAKSYLALRSALSACRRRGGNCSTIGANLDRWRALPRDFEERYLWVNVPAFRLDLIEHGKVVASHRIVVGKPGSRTPVFKATVTGVTINPWWNVPCSIVDESVGALIRDKPAEAARRGYVASRDKKGQLVVRQKPGPQNALGQIKLEMPNPFSVYIHDTPSKTLFDRNARAFSHGCIRTEHPAQLAGLLLSSGQMQQAELLLASGATRTLKLEKSVPVYVVYLTAEPATSAAESSLVTYPDIYKLDGR